MSWKGLCSDFKIEPWDVKEKYKISPLLDLYDIIKGKCKEQGIQVEEVGENYTSQTSVIDHERPVPENAKKSRRKKRGLFKSNEHIPIQADLNSAYQIACKKVDVNYTPKFIRSVKKTKIA